jgi:hypothetical protein
MPKEENVRENSFGLMSVTLGIISIVLTNLPGLILGIVALVFAFKQEKISINNWSKAGKILSIIGIILTIIAIALNMYFFYNSENFQAIINGAVQ